MNSQKMDTQTCRLLLIENKADLDIKDVSIRDVLNSLMWDGMPRIRSCLHHFLGADESDYVEEMLKHFLLGAIRRVFHPGSKYEELLCLVGGQGAGKSTFFRFLAIQDEWFSDDLKKLDDDKVFAKLQGHWIIEMSEMLATSNAKSIEEIRSFISRQKETYRTPYETQPKDRLRQCVFGGSSNTLDFLPLDRAGNRRFLPVMIYPEKAEVHILEDEAASREYLLQVWAEAMTIYRSGEYSMKFSKEIQRQLVEVQKDFMPEDTEAGQIQGFLDELENQRMSVTEEMIQAYREQVAPYLYVTPQTPLTNSDSSGELGTLTSQYLDHAIDLDTYIREMDQRVRMMMLEDM